MKSESALFQELFGGSTVTESLGGTVPVVHQRPEPTLPTDSELWTFTPAPSGRATQEIEDRDFIKVISGWDVPITQPTPAPDIGRKVIADATHYFVRAGEVAKGAPRRKQALREIVESTLGDFVAKHYPRQIADPVRKAEIDGHFDRITASAEKILSQVLVECA